MKNTIALSDDWRDEFLTRWPKFVPCFQFHVINDNIFGMARKTMSPERYVKHLERCEQMKARNKANFEQRMADPAWQEITRRLNAVYGQKWPRPAVEKRGCGVAGQEV